MRFDCPINSWKDNKRKLKLNSDFIFFKCKFNVEFPECSRRWKHYLIAPVIPKIPIPIINIGTIEIHPLPQRNPKSANPVSKKKRPKITLRSGILFFSFFRLDQLFSRSNLSTSRNTSFTSSSLSQFRFKYPRTADQESPRCRILITYSSSSFLDFIKVLVEAIGSQIKTKSSHAFAQ